METSLEMACLIMSYRFLLLKLLSDLINFRMKSISLAKHTKPFTLVSSKNPLNVISYYSLPLTLFPSSSYRTFSEFSKIIQVSRSLYMWALAWSTFTAFCTKQLLFLENLAQLLAPLALLCPLYLPSMWQVPIFQRPTSLGIYPYRSTYLLYCFIMNYFKFRNCRAFH